MKKYPGFGLIGTLIVIVAVLLIGIVAWRVWNTNANQQATDTSVGMQIKQTEKTNPNADYVVIKEMGIKLTLNGGVKDLTYKATTLADGSQSATFSTKTLEATDSACDAAAGPLGSLEMTTVDTDRAGAKKIVDNISTFKLGAYYLTYSGPQALCSDRVSGSLHEPTVALREALKTMRLDQ